MESFIHLRKGDIVRLNTKLDEPVRVDIGGKSKFAGRAGQVGRKLAVQILGRLAEPEDEVLVESEEEGDTDNG